MLDNLCRGRSYASVLCLLAVVNTGCLQPDDFDVRSVAIADFRSLGDAETTVGVDIGLYNPNG